jgi:PTH1 family peptidyl-tRNA hydrolase
MVIVGLGNPGKRYEHTRHNAGWDVVEALAARHGSRFSIGRGDFLRSETSIGGRSVHLVLPLVFMNESGRAVVRALEEASAGPSELLVVCDDVNLEPGRLRLRPSGSDGGHNGVASVIDHLGTSEFARLRLGVGAPPPEVDLADYVLATFEPAERPVVDEMLERAQEAVLAALTLGFDRAMSEHNRRTGSSDEPDV